MTNQGWRPLFTRDGAEPSEFDVLHEDIPDWLQGSVWRWLMDRAAEGGHDLILRLERRLHVALATAEDRPYGGRHTLAGPLLERHWSAVDGNGRLTLLDAILSDLQARGRNASDDGDVETVERVVEAAERLDTILIEGGSAWHVPLSASDWGLARRVDEQTQEVVRAATSPATDAARRLKVAWESCYRLNPDYDSAYRSAVLAVEAVTIPVTVPNSPRASLGQVISHIKDTKSLWTIGHLDAPEIASAETLLDLLKTIWHNQQRHAQRDGTIVDVSREEAEAAVGLAVIAVHLFSANLATKAGD